MDKLIRFVTRAALLGVVLSVVSACPATVGVEDNTIPTNTGQTCENQCASIGMSLSAVALMANTIGCVCEPTETSSSDARVRNSSAASAGGMVTIMLAEQAAQQQQQKQQQQQQRPQN